MTDTYVIHEVNCEDGSSIYRDPNEAELQHFEKSKNQIDRPVDEKLQQLKNAARQSSSEMYDLLMYLVGEQDVNSE